jgi:hypothetical protein
VSEIPAPNAVPRIPDLVLDPQRLWLALAGVGVMHFFLTKRPLGLLKRVVGS